MRGLCSDPFIHNIFWPHLFLLRGWEMGRFRGAGSLQWLRASPKVAPRWSMRPVLRTAKWAWPWLQVRCPAAPPWAVGLKTIMSSVAMDGITSSRGCWEGSCLHCESLPKPLFPFTQSAGIVVYPPPFSSVRLRAHLKNAAHCAFLQP